MGTKHIRGIQYNGKLTLTMGFMDGVYGHAGHEVLEYIYRNSKDQLIDQIRYFQDKWSDLARKQWDDYQTYYNYIINLDDETYDYYQHLQHPVHFYKEGDYRDRKIKIFELELRRMNVIAEKDQRYRVLYLRIPFSDIRNDRSCGRFFKFDKNSYYSYLTRLYINECGCCFTSRCLTFFGEECCVCQEVENICENCRIKLKIEELNDEED